ncbi:MAG: CHAT domain-containing protein [Bacteroidetes bacterium]|nr:CHAT domain-containing protein [Bacteroidota bacterium]
MGNLMLALDYHNKAFSIIKAFYCNLEGYKSDLSCSRHPDYLRCLNNLGAIYAELVNIDSSHFFYNQLLNNINSNIVANFAWLSSDSKKLFWKMNEVYFDRFVYFSSVAYKFSLPTSYLSYNSALIAKSLVLDDNLGFQQAIRSSNNNLVQQNYKELFQLRQRLVNFEFKTGVHDSIKNNLINKADSIDKILVSEIGEYASLKHRFELRWTDVQQSLQVDEAAIEFTRYYDYQDTCYKYMAQVIRKGYEYPHLVKLCAEKELPFTKISSNLPKLYKLVWQPLDTLLKGVTTVYYSPDGRLSSVPFHALCSNDTAGCTYLIDQFTLHRLSTTRYLADSTLIKTKNLEGSIALFGGIQYDVQPDSSNQKKEESNEDFLLSNTLQRESTRGAMSYLPGTKAEVESIAPLFKNLQWTTSLSTGILATETAFKILSDTGSPSIIHIATHGFAFPDKDEKHKDGKGMMMMTANNQQQQYKAAEDPMLRCGLMFAGANLSWTGKQAEMLQKTGDDGILTAAEVSALDLSQTKLVVLSACETGLGKIEGSEGVFGLQRGFKLAGVEQLIVSLWSVPDKETMQLMTTFYSDLAITKDPVKSFAGLKLICAIITPIIPKNGRGLC